MLLLGVEEFFRFITFLGRLSIDPPFDEFDEATDEGALDDGVPIEKAAYCFVGGLVRGFEDGFTVGIVAVEVMAEGAIGFGKLEPGDGFAKAEGLLLGTLELSEGPTRGIEDIVGTVGSVLLRRMEAGGDESEEEGMCLGRSLVVDTFGFIVGEGRVVAEDGWGG